MFVCFFKNEQKEIEDNVCLFVFLKRTERNRKDRGQCLFVFFKKKTKEIEKKTENH